MGASAREPPEPAPQERNVFSTAGLPAARRIERWESHNAAALIGLDVRAAGPLEATEVNVRLPVVRLARVRGSAHVVERTPKVIDRCPADSIAIYLTLRGDASFASADGSRELRPGEPAGAGPARAAPRPGRRRPSRQAGDHVVRRRRRAGGRRPSPAARRGP